MTEKSEAPYYLRCSASDLIGEHDAHIGAIADLPRLIRTLLPFPKERLIFLTDLQMIISIRFLAPHIQ